MSFMLSSQGRREWIAVSAIGLMITVTCVIVGWPWGAAAAATATVAVLSFFRDPKRRIPTQRGVVVSPADGRVTSIHRVDDFEPFGEPALCVRVFLSVLNVHVNRSPCHGAVDSITHRNGRHLSALNPSSAEVNEWNLITFRHPARGHLVAAVRQVSGQLARTIRCGVKVDQIVQRGQRIGFITLGSTTELYLPVTAGPQILVGRGQRVYGGTTLMARVASAAPASAPDDDSSGAAAANATVESSAVQATIQRPPAEPVV